MKSFPISAMLSLLYFLPRPIPGPSLALPLVTYLARSELQVGLAHPTNSALGKLTDDLLKKLGLHAKVYDEERARPVVHTDAAHDLVNKMRVGALDLAVVYRSNVQSTPENLKHLTIIEMVAEPTPIREGRGKTDFEEEPQIGPYKVAPLQTLSCGELARTAST